MAFTWMAVDKRLVSYLLGQCERMFSSRSSSRSPRRAGRGGPSAAMLAGNPLVRFIRRGTRLDRDRPNTLGALSGFSVCAEDGCDLLSTVSQREGAEVESEDEGDEQLKVLRLVEDGSVEKFFKRLFK